ncbi:NAD(P)H-hydrate dehydratase [Deinococcus sp. SDU3-2]|uniref:Bifunctional NAD(P)H-hydrate repair enzyme n=1 Tax=Deinococcus terrestris TaxID=2651870 RepID=A0A7X1NU98_9DEIO|nr:NAD(P)H-hydrate dehydratase [Deinococcus terrestris]MPY65778.1 NAD(P)H-hydrate dehydratase [Deinococcus terrestris]
MTEFVFRPAGVAALDARLEAAGLLDPAMEEVGRAVAEAAQGLAGGGPVLLLAGSGANGGDALVAARYLAGWGAEVRVLAAPSRHALTRLNRERLAAFGVEVGELTPGAVTREAWGSVVLVDGLLGTGFQPPLRLELAAVVEAVNAARGAGTRVLAIDLPSGLDATSAVPPGESVRADVTVAPVGLKPALLFGEAATRAGEVRVAALALPPDWAAGEAWATRPDDAAVAALLPVRRADAHKGTAGDVWIVGGAPGMVGAAALAGLGALRAGAGRVTLHSGAEVPLVTPELMVRRHGDPGGWLAGTGERPDAVAVGMGLGPGAAGLARTVLGWGLPTVLDADALQPELAGAGHDRCVWTPHPGEAARLLGVGTAEVTRDPLTAARGLQERFGGVVVLKGGPSVIAHPGGRWVSRGGHPGMASAGMGDTLAGVIAALLGQGLSAADAALAGVRLHARAGERAGIRHGYGLTATDVSAQLGGAWLDLTGGAGRGC